MLDEREERDVDREGDEREERGEEGEQRRDERYCDVLGEGEAEREEGDGRGCWRRNCVGTELADIVYDFIFDAERRRDDPVRRAR